MSRAIQQVQNLPLATFSLGEAVPIPQNDINPGFGVSGGGPCSLRMTCSSLLALPTR